MTTRRYPTAADHAELAAELLAARARLQTAAEIARRFRPNLKGWIERVGLAVDRLMQRLGQDFEYENPSARAATPYPPIRTRFKGLPGLAESARVPAPQSIRDRRSTARQRAQVGMVKRKRAAPARRSKAVRGGL